jgi:acyl-coenzyme A synthetase/AMP-(fatty) acid ligase/thioesterase domain-containing protein/acyl carrier protein
MSLDPLVVPGEYRTVGGRLRAVAIALADQPAIVAYGETSTYRDVVGWAQADAAQIRARLGAPAGRSAGAPARAGAESVAILIEPSARSLAAVLGVMSSGCPVVILDPLLPLERQRRILDRAAASLLLADPVSWQRAKQLAPDPARRMIIGGGAGSSNGSCAPDSPPGGPELGAADAVLAIQFTSGTGRPKAVLQTHGMWLNSAYEARAAFGLEPGVRVALTLPVGYGPGLEVLLFTLLNGGTLLVRDDAADGPSSLGRWVVEERVEHLVLTPSRLRALCGGLRADDVLNPVRRLVTTGGELQGEDVRIARLHLPQDAVVTTWLGSAETGSIAFLHLPSDVPAPDGALPIGRAATNKELTIAPGAAPELLVRSRYLASGYLDEPEQTARRFERADDGSTIHRTGELGRIDAEGVLHRIGAAHQAVRVGGYLVDVSEVEAALRELPEVSDALVVAEEQPGGATRLRAHAAVREGTRAPSEAAIRTALRRRLPAWMIPTHIVLVDALPGDASGALLGAGSVHGRGAVAPPSGETEERLAGIWRQVLGVEEVGRTDDLAEMGGDSLSVEEMLSIVDEVFGVELTSAHYAAAPTLAQLAELIDNHRLGADWRPPALVPLQRHGSRTPLFIVAGAGGTALAFRPLARELGPDQPVYGLQAHGLENRGVPDWTVRRAARRYVEALNQICPRGPVALAGHYYGGFVALEMARLLREQGREPSAVILVDAILDGPIARNLGLAELQADALRLPARARGMRALGVGLWRTRAMLAVLGVVRFRPSTQWLLFWEQSMRILQRHRPAPWSGQLHVLRSADNPDDPTWWARLGAGEVIDAEVPGGHNGMLRPPHVAALARHIHRALTQDTARDRRRPLTAVTTIQR